jgi:hypothetical protein
MSDLDPSNHLQGRVEDCICRPAFLCSDDLNLLNPDPETLPSQDGATETFPLRLPKRLWFLDDTSVNIRLLAGWGTAVILGLMGL